MNRGGHLWAKNIFRKMKKQNEVLKTIGFIALPLGVILAGSGVFDAFRRFEAFRTTRADSACFRIFLGFALVFVGISCLSYAYMGKVARYTASEIAPVKKDTANYLIDGTKDEISDLFHKIKGQTIVNCPYCGDENDPDAIYCDYCGRKLRVTCDCGTENQAGSRYCKKCGKTL